MKNGFSLIEILLAVALFAIVASFFIILMVESYKLNSRTQDYNKAIILAEEGLEAVRSIRDANFADLITAQSAYSKCLEIKNDRWVLKRIVNRHCLESVDKFNRQVFIAGSGNRRNITVVVSWQPLSGAKKEVKLCTRLTNWRR